MTGHPGERTSQRVALVTDDFRLYHVLVPLFEREGLPLLGLAPGEAIPEHIDVLLDGPGDDPRTIAVPEDPQAAILAVREAMHGRTYRQIVFGIDPGDTIGLAVLADDQVLLTAQVFDAADAVDRIEAWCDGLDARGWMAHIGDGAPAIGVRMEGLIHKRLPDVAVRFVPEDRTTPESPATQSRHTDAAIHIARRAPST